LTDLPTTSRSIDGLMILAPGVTGFGNVSNISNPQISGSHYWGRYQLQPEWRQFE
jgi:hypothetical protein